METLRTISDQMVRSVSLDFNRYVSKKINIDERLNILIGSRGVGKTTLFLQLIKQKFQNDKIALYASADDLYFAKYSILELAGEFTKRGGKYLFIDEIHKYQGWSKELKLIYDRYPELKVSATGSSIMEILKGEADLSRRAVISQMEGLSLREFIHYEYGENFQSFSMKDILEKGREISIEISAEVKVIKLFEEYLRYGYFPFSKNSRDSYYQKIRQILNVILEVDIPSTYKVNYQAVRNIYKLLGIIAEMVPFKPNISELASKIGLSRETFIKYLQYLSKAGVINSVFSSVRGIKSLNKPEKIFLQNTNFLYAFGKSVNVGNLRETFFLNQISTQFEVVIPPAGDFLVEDEILFEVGGPKKNFQQIANIENSWIAADNIEIAVDKKIPLWLFGFLY